MVLSIKRAFELIIPGYGFSRCVLQIFFRFFCVNVSLASGKSWLWFDFFVIEPQDFDLGLWTRRSVLKGYLHYKTITSQNVLRLRIFLFHRKVIFRSRDLQVFVFLTIPWFIKSVTPWWILVHETVQFWIYILNQNSLSHQTWSIDRYKQVQFFMKSFERFERLGLSSRPFPI